MTVKCPKCGCRKWREGPSGGMAVNIQCENGHCWWWGLGRLEPIPNVAFGPGPGCTCDGEKVTA